MIPIDGLLRGENMRYYVQYDKFGNVCVIGTNIGGVEVSESEYNDILLEIQTKSRLVDSLYNGEISVDDVPDEWREEIQNRADRRTERENEAAETAEATESDYQKALRDMGVVV